MADKLYISETPEDVKSAKGLHLLTANTPNGQAKEDWFLRLNPNGRIPVLIDNTQSPPFPVHETSAELFYLLKFADKDDKFGFKDELERSEAIQWTFFWHGSGAPYQGQTVHFLRAPEKIECKKTPRGSYYYAINRFRNETLRVFGVLEIRLSGKYTGEPREYLAGKGKGKYSIADIKTWPWVNAWEKTGFKREEVEQFPHLLKWIDRIAQRPAVQKGIDSKYTKS
ncbi:glutathione S-transferase [Hypoxylon sp. FL1150]|nr:glutathione S-transferase [Hypoxylon sp. FL1150]